MISEEPLVLYGVFRELVRHQVSLGVTDYLDALRALQVQIERRDDQRFFGRESLRQLCRIMWARSPEEVRLIDRILDGIAAPGPDELASAQQLLDSVPGLLRSGLPQPAGLDRGGSGAGSVEVGRAEVEPQQHVAVSFESARDGGGLPLPYPVLPARQAETFVMQPQTIMSPRALAVLWRRYRRMARTGPRTELDVDATIAEQSRRGIVHLPVMRPARTNTARLLILADTSHSMAAWRPFVDALEASIALSRLQAVRLLYLANLPRRSLFESPQLTGAVPAQKVSEQFAGGALLVVSDCGAARGFLNRSRAAQTRTFLGAANRQMRRVVWINPMPADRWRGTTADAAAAGGTTPFLPLNQVAMIRAVDILRGARTH